MSVCYTWHLTKCIPCAQLNATTCLFKLPLAITPLLLPELDTWTLHFRFSFSSYYRRKFMAIDCLVLGTVFFRIFDFFSPYRNCFLVIWLEYKTIRRRTGGRKELRGCIYKWKKDHVWLWDAHGLHWSQPLPWFLSDFKIWRFQ